MKTKLRLSQRVAFNLIVAVVIGVCFGARQGVAQQSVIGRWDAVTNPLPFFPVHSHTLPTGKVMIWPGDEGISGNDPRSWDPANESISPLTPPGYDIFCSGHSFLSDGTLFVAGGHFMQNGIGVANASIYNPVGNAWTRLPDMNAGRWYPTVTVLANGDPLVVSGSDDTNFGVNTLPQVFQLGSGTWRDLTSAQLGMDLYPMMLLAPNGKVFNPAPTQTTRYLDTAGSGTWSFVANRVGPYRDYGSAVMYAPGKVLVMGGGDPPTNTAEVIDLNQPSPTWRAVDSMAFARRDLNATLLPDGTVLVTGGTSFPGFNDPAGAVHAAELWNPTTEQWTTLASTTSGIPRVYHSTALLLPDARVLSMGGNVLQGYPDTRTAEIYSPPYLFDASTNLPAPRPTITSAPASVAYGQSFFLGTPDAAAISKVTMLRLSSVTHAFDMSQHISTLNFSHATGGLNVVAPSGATVAPPGRYLLFILNGSGVPSVGSIVQVGSAVTGSLGAITREVWTGISGATVANIPVGTPPSLTDTLPSFEAPTNWADNYGTRMRGYITAPVTGNYTFWIASDENGELWLSTNDNPANKVRIAWVSDYTDSRQWNKYSTQKSAAIPLTAGQRYYVEALQKEAVGGDNLAVGWAKPGESTSAPSEVIAGSVLSPFTAIAGPEINILGNGTIIVDGDTTPSGADHTDFGSTAFPGGTVTRTFTIQNIGTDPLTVNPVTLSGANAADFSVIVQPASAVAAGGATNFQVRFTPSATGTRTATLSVGNNDAGENPYDFALQGTGVTAVPEINVLGNGTTIVDGDTTPSGADNTGFASTAFPGGTATRTFTIQNLGTASLTVNPVTLSGANAADFSVIVQPASTVAAGGSTSFQVGFTPSALGTRTATVSVGNNDADENPYDFALQGTGVTAGSGFITREVWTGISGATVANIPVGAAPDLTDTLPNFEAPTNWADRYGTRIRGYITAPMTGNYTFWIASDDNGELWLSLNDNPANKVNIASVPDWTNSREWNKYSTQKSATITLTQGQRYYVEALQKEAIGGDNLAVGWAKPGESTSAPSEVIPGSVLLPFTATAGPEITLLGNGTTIIDGDTIPSGADQTDFGSTAFPGGTVTRTFTIQNLGTVPLTVNPVTLSGANAADFSVIVQPASMVAAGGSTSFQVRFTPSALGTRTATVSVGNNDTNENPYDFALQGTGVTAGPEINVLGNGTTIVDGDTTPSGADQTDFGSTAFPGGTVTRTFTIQNLGTASLTVNPVTLSGANAADFSVIVQPASTVATGGSTSFQVRFTPSALGTRTATVSVGNNDADENPYDFALQGTGATAGSGFITREVWTGISGATVANIPVGAAPNLTDTLPSFEAPTNWADNYGTRIRGYITAPMTGNYTFWIASDDNGELWLSTNDNPANKVNIASVPDWTNSREWNKYSTQKSATITLTQGQRYYVEALQKEAIGGDNLAVGWAKPGEATSAPSEVIPGWVLSPFTGTAGPALISIAVTPVGPSILTGATQQFTATGTYSDLSTQNITSQVTWASSSTTVATITTPPNGSGLATGVSAGSTTISATLSGVTGSTTLTVQAAPVTLSSIAVTPPSPTILTGATQQFTATGTYSDLSTQNITSQVTWASSSTTVATITTPPNGSGLATSVSAGSTTISATLSGVTGSTTLTVQAAPVTLSSIAVTPVGPSILTGATQQFTATGTYSDLSTQNITSQVTWASSSTTVATITTPPNGSGLATGVSAGSTTISATLSGVTGSTTLTVQAAPVTLSSIAVTPVGPSILTGATQQFTATGTYSDLSTQNITSQVTWASSSTTVATITTPPNGSGLATSVSAGSTTISATLSGVTGSTTLTVQAAPVTLSSIAVTPPSPTILTGATQQFTATGTYSDLSTQNITSQVTWASSSATVATINASGLATGVSAGSTTISATLSGVTGSTTLTVQAAPVTLSSIAVTPPSPTILTGATQQFTATGTYSDLSTQNITSQVTWASSSTTVATITTPPNGSGLATGVSAGSTTISATLSGVTGSTTLTVQAAPVTLSSIAVTPVGPSILTGATQQFTATGTYSDLSTQNITSQVTWASSSTTVATITTPPNGSGLATGVSAGSTTISATLSGVTGSAMLTVAAPLVITTNSLPNGSLNVFYSATLNASGGTPPYTSSIVSGSGSLPKGLSLNQTTRVISGTPKPPAGSSSFTARVTDAGGATATKAFTITIQR